MISMLAFGFDVARTSFLLVVVVVSRLAFNNEIIVFKAFPPDAGLTDSDFDSVVILSDGFCALLEDES